MHLEAHFSSQDLAHVLARLTPLRIALDANSDKRFLALSPPSHVAIVPGRGVRIVSDVQLQWDVVGLRVPVSLKSVSVLLSPSVAQADNESVLLLGVRIEDADLSAIPSFLQGVILDQVNDALQRHESRIAWRFMDTLDFSFRLPRQVHPRYRIRLYAAAGSSRVADRLVFSVDWGLDSHPHDSPSGEDGTAAL